MKTCRVTSTDDFRVARFFPSLCIRTADRAGEGKYVYIGGVIHVLLCSYNDIRDIRRLDHRTRPVDESPRRKATRNRAALRCSSTPEARRRHAFSERPLQLQLAGCHSQDNVEGTSLFQLLYSLIF